MRREGSGEKERPAFERVLGSLGATAVSLGGIIGSGIFFIVGIAAGEAGPAVILSLVIAGVVAVFTALSFASLGSKIQKEGGEYQFVYVAFGPLVGLLGGLLWIASTAVAGVTVSIALASYVVALFPVVGVNALASLACIAFMLVDMVGLRISSSVNHALVLVKVGVLLFFIVFGLSFVDPANFRGFMAKGWDGVLASTFLIFFAYAGFGKITAASEEVKDPERTIPRAIIAAIAVSAVIYFLCGLVAVGVAGSESLSTTYRSAPFAYVMLSTGFRPAFLLVAVGAITATSNVLLIQMLGLSRTVYAMSVNGQLPRILRELHPRFGTPYRAEVAIGILMAIGAFFLDLNSVVAVTSLGILSYYGLINLSALRLELRTGRVSYPRRAIPVLGFLSCALLVAYFLWTRPL